MPHHGFNRSPARGGHQLQSLNNRAGQNNSAQNTGQTNFQAARRSQRLQGNNQQGQGANAQQVEALRARIAALTQENTSLKQDIEKHKGLHRNYRATIDDKALECVELKAKVENLGKQIASGNQGAGWGLAGLLSRPREAQKAENEDLTKLRAKAAWYIDTIAKLQDRNQQLEQKADQQAQEIQNLIARFTQEIAELELKVSIDTPKPSDTEIQGQWNALGSSIQQFVLRYLRAPLDEQALQALAQSGMFNWLPDMVQTLQVPFLRPIVLESWIWHFLCFRVFDSGSGLWAGEVGRAFSTSCEEVRSVLSRQLVSSNQPSITLEQFHDWRVRSAHLICQLQAHDVHHSVEQTTEIMLNALKMVMPQTVSHGQLEDMERDALDIMHKAAELDKIFRLSKADFHVFITRIKLPLVHPPMFRFRFDPETMERVKNVPDMVPGNSKPIVDLAVSPGILKAGNADGANYNSERILAKLKAFCGLPALVELFQLGGDGDAQGEVRTERVHIKQEQMDQDEDDPVSLLVVKPEPMSED